MIGYYNLWGGDKHPLARRGWIANRFYRWWYRFVEFPATGSLHVQLPPWRRRWGVRLGIYQPTLRELADKRKAP